MPLEIRELVIRVNVVDQKVAPAPKIDVAALKREILAECLQVIKYAQVKVDDDR